MKTVYDGITFDSRGEAVRYLELKSELEAGRISHLQLQKSFRLVVNEVLVARYVCDFCYMRDGKRVVEDYKGMRTAVYKIKRSLMKAIHGIDIVETTG